MNIPPARPPYQSHPELCHVHLVQRRRLLSKGVHVNPETHQHCFLLKQIKYIILGYFDGFNKSLTCSPVKHYAFCGNGGLGGQSI